MLHARATSDIATNDLELIPDKSSLLKETFLWDKDLTLRAGIGYNDNVLLSPSAPQGSFFFKTGLDLLVFRLPLDGLEFNLSVTGDDVRYWRDIQGVNVEDAFAASIEAQKYFGEHWRGGLELRYLYLNEVAQELVQTGGVSTVIAKGDTFSFRPFVRRDLGTNWWAQLEVPVSREWWQPPLDDVWKLGPEAVLGRTYGLGSQVALTCGTFYIPHDQWLARTADGTEIPGKALVLWRQVAELKWEHQWDEARRWRSITKLGFQYNQDNGGGFYDYYRYAFSEELRFNTKNWEIRGSAGVSYYNFPVQTVDTTVNSPKLYLTTLNLSLRVERRIYKALKAFAQIEHQRVISDQSDSEYTDNVTSGGLSWEF